MFKKSEIDNVVNEIRSNKNQDLSACIMYDVSDYTIWVDFVMQNESRRYHSNTIHKMIWDEYYDYISNFKKINTEDLVKFFEGYLELPVDANN